MVNTYFKKEGHKFITTKPCELVIHKENVTENIDGNLDTFMFGSLIIFHDGEKEIRKTITLGTKVVVPIYTSEQISESDDGKHKVIHFEEGDVFIENDEVVATINNVYELFNNFIVGRLSPEIPREKYYTIMINSMNTNFKLKFPRIYIELMIGQMFVDEKGTLSRLSNSDKSFPLGVTDLVQNSNTFNSMTFEDFNKSCLINLGKTPAEQVKDPSVLEKYLRY